MPAELVTGLRLDDIGSATTTAWRDLALAAVQIGVGRAARDWLVGFLSRRTPGGTGEPLGALPHYQAALGELESALIGAEELVTGLAGRIDAGDETAVARTGPAHLLVCRAVVDAVRAAVELTGSAGLSRRQPLERQLRDALSGQVHGRPRRPCWRPPGAPRWTAGSRAPWGRAAQRVPTAARTARRASAASSYSRRIISRCSSPAPGTS